MNWLVGGVVAVVAAAVIGPPLLRAAAKNPQLLTEGADAIEAGRAKAIEYGKRGAAAAYDAGKRGAAAAYDAARAEVERRRASQVGAFAGYLR